MNKSKKIKFAIGTSIILLIVIVCAYVYSILNNMYVGKRDIKNNNSFEYSEEGIRNILLVGIDSKYDDEKHRADGLILVSMNNNTKNIKLTSISRDTYVDIDEHGKDKLNRAYSYGNIELLRNTIEDNLNIYIDNYIIVNFTSFMDIIDEIGGVEVNIEDKNIEDINLCINNSYKNYYSKKDNVERIHITEPGIQTLNGYQALAFVRMRNSDNGFERERRQRELIESFYNQLIGSNPLSYKKCVEIISSNIKTDIAPVEMINLAYEIVNYDEANIEQLQFPLEEYRNGHVIDENSGWVIEWNKDENLKALHNFIYNK